MFCRKCGSQNSDDSKFCRSCGASITSDDIGFADEVNNSAKEPLNVKSDYFSNVTRQQEDTPVGALKHRLPIGEFFLNKGNKRYLVLTIIGLVSLFFGGLWTLLAFFFLTCGIVFGLYTYSATIEMVVITSKDKCEIENIINAFFNSKQKWSSRKWMDVNGAGWINKEIEVSAIPLPAEFDTSGKAVISIDIFNNEEGKSIVDIWTSEWTILRWLIPRGLSKTKHAIKQLARELENEEYSSSTNISLQPQSINISSTSNPHQFGKIEGVNSDNYQDFVNMLLSKNIEMTGTNGSLSIQDYSRYFGQSYVTKIKIRFSGNRITIYTYISINGISAPEQSETNRLVRSYFSYENEFFNMNGKATSINQKSDHIEIVVETALFPNHIHANSRYSFAYILFSIISQLGLCANTLESDLRIQVAEGDLAPLGQETPVDVHLIQSERTIR